MSYLNNRFPPYMTHRGKPLPKYLTDAGCTFALNVDRQVKALANPNSPLVNPLIDVVGKLGKNLFDGFLELGIYGVTGLKSASSNYIRSVNFFKVTSSTQYRISSTPSYAYDVCFYDANKAFLSRVISVSSFTTPSNCEYVAFNSTATGQNDLSTKIMLNEGSVPLTYEPYGFNNVLLQSFTGTTADGYTQIALPNGKNPWFLKFDGTDSLGIMANTADVDILGTNDFAISTVFRTGASLNATRIIVAKSDSSSPPFQYVLYTNSVGELALFLGSDATALTSALQINTLYNVLITRKSNVLRCFLLNVKTREVSNTTNIPSKPNFRVGARATNVGGTTHVEYFNGDLGNLAIFYNGATGLDITKVEKAVAKLNANYI